MGKMAMLSQVVICVEQVLIIVAACCCGIDGVC